MKTFALDLEGKRLVRLSCPRCWNRGYRAVLVLEEGEPTPGVTCPRCGTTPRPSSAADARPAAQNSRHGDRALVRQEEPLPLAVLAVSREVTYGG